ncbi:hypothetical protein [Bacillus sp. 1P06AnD]|uniref:hypothetical protein n=1 Tax=Bacillus sp. 1P06AnD TaxID=3132208 RepID=UPI0039A081EB
MVFVSLINLAIILAIIAAIIIGIKKGVSFLKENLRLRNEQNQQLKQINEKLERLLSQMDTKGDL